VVGNLTDTFFPDSGRGVDADLHLIVFRVHLLGVPGPRDIRGAVGGADDRFHS
jgi:hypothetical protein